MTNSGFYKDGTTQTAMSTTTSTTKCDGRISFFVAFILLYAWSQCSWVFIIIVFMARVEPQKAE